MIIRYMRLVLVVFCFGIMPVLFSAEKQTKMVVTAEKHQQVPLLLSYVKTVSADEQLCIETIKKDLSFSEQFLVTMDAYEKGVSRKNIIKKAAEKGFWMVLCIDFVDANFIEWRLYDALQELLLAGKKYKKRGTVVRGWGHNIADCVWPILTNQDGWFTSKITYCKAKKTKRGYRIQHICMADYDGSNEEELVSLPTICVAPHWHHDLIKPKVLYSEYTNMNVRLMSVDMYKKRSILLNGDGITMLPAFYKDGASFVYCASEGTGACQLYHFSKGKVVLLTDNEYNNISPSFGADEHTIYYCSDVSGSPQIYCHSLRLKTTIPITHGGFCTSPCYNQQTNQLVYLKMVKKMMQIYVYDVKSGKHKQLTHDNSSKGACVWSPCGQYLLFDETKSGSSRLVLLHVLSGSRRFLTPPGIHCSYPDWSPVYKLLPTVME